MIAVATPVFAAEEAVTITKKGKAGEEVRVRRHAEFDQCQPTQAPSVSIVYPPSDGQVEVRAGPVILPAVLLRTGWTCRATTIENVDVYYVPARDFRGTVEFVYDVQSQGGRTRYKASVVLE